MTVPSSSQLSPLKQALLALDEMQAKLDQQARARTEPIAVIGLGCRFPGGASSPRDYWHLLHDGVEAIREVPADRWDVEQVFDRDPDTPGRTYVRRQDVPRVFRINAALYLFRTEFLRRETETWLNGRHLLLEIPEERAFHIDDEHGFRMCELALEQGLVELPWLAG